MYFRRTCLLRIFVILFLILNIFLLYLSRKIYIYNQYYCYSLNELDEVLDIQDTDVKNDSVIFFLDTTCDLFINETIMIRSRQACAIESAALMNPQKTIYLLHSSPGWLIENETISSQLLNFLTLYSNINIRHINLDRFAKDSPVEKLWKSNEVYKSNYPRKHISDIFGVLLLWRYGGIYMDLDVIVTKNLELLPDNFVGAEPNSDVNNDIIGFDSQTIGHEYAQAVLNELAENFDSQSWTGNGACIFNRLLKQRCDQKIEPAAVGKNRKCLNVLPQNTFYRFKYSEETDYIKKEIENSYVVHFCVWPCRSQRGVIYEQLVAIG
ncbi:hypothetical protein GWI33_021639 [Rhynchophorus ferrugineus]|uniref:Alpha 1,4-glycosyltransferase domain-containing protein n=1 Tax=Rhynchophorus ferrugineus TaxID=354439 RepID=A0A834MIF1_RHYFE|nr:hypothetical protein GWI33_021639 [Rhynchophorus ferrugineus]